MILIEETSEAVVYQGGELLPSYFKRVARCSPNGTINIAGLRRIKHSLTGWINCTPTSDINVVEPIQARINERGKVQLRGKFTLSADQSMGRCFDLPDTFKPSFDQAIPVYATGLDAPSFQKLIIVNSRNGWVGYAVFAALEGSVIYNLDACQFEL
jgi:hypothetical protein